MELSKNGCRPMKKKSHRGRPKAGKPANSLLRHIEETASIPLSEQSELVLVHDAPTSSKVVCNVCHWLLQQPLELPCTHYACARCIHTLVLISGSLKCPTCSTTHPLAAASVKAPSPLLVDLLAEQLTVCERCKETVEVGVLGKHRSSDFTRYTTTTLQQFL